MKALHSTSGRLDASATWLLENATPIIQQTTEQNGGGWQFAGFEVSDILTFLSIIYFIAYNNLRINVLVKRSGVISFEFKYIL